MDAYTLAVLANFAVDADKDSALTHRILQKLIDARTEKDEQTWWSSEETSVYSTGSDSARLLRTADFTDLLCGNTP